MSVTAALVKELRERTGAGMMDCKRALQAHNGDMEKAIEDLRKSGIAKAAKKASRTAAEGAVVALTNDAQTQAVLLEVNSETDFVARDENFLHFCQIACACALKHQVNDVPALLAIRDDTDQTIEDRCKALIAKVGENVKIRRLTVISTEQGIIGTYVHGGRIGVLIETNTSDIELAKDLAMHVAASNPRVIYPTDFPEDELVKERAIYEAKSKDSGKPQHIVDKMIAGQVNKFLNQVSLVGQPFIKDPELDVGKLLSKHNAEVKHLVRYEVGEGIAREETDFRKEVMDQVQGS